jgi:fatty-acyl-CoA synthase
MERLTIGELFDRAALGMGERDAVVFSAQAVRWKYRELHARVVQLAKGLMGLGVDVGDHVGIFAANRVEWTLVQLAVAKVGAILVPVDPTASVEHLAHVLAHSDTPTLFVIDDTDGVSSYEVLAECCPELATARPGHLSSRRFPQLKRVIHLGDAATERSGVLAWSGVLAGGAGISDHLLRRRQEPIEAADVAMIQYTAGTTGVPKGVELTHANVVNDAIGVGDCMRIARKDRVCVPVSFARTLGCVVGALGSLGRGATMVVPAERFDAGSLLAAIASERCTAVVTETRMLVSALRHPDVLHADVQSLRTGLMVGACPVGLMPEIVTRLHLPDLTVGYGQTETTAVVTQSRPGDSLDLRATTVGRALPDLEVKIVDPVTGVDLPTGSEGELCCRGYPVMRGYYKLPETTTATLGANGWLRTGDLAVMDRFGDCMITGRVAVKSS